MITIERRSRKRYVYTKPDGRRGWKHDLFEPQQEPYYVHLLSCFTRRNEEFKPGFHSNTVNDFLRFFPEVVDAVGEGVTITSTGGFDYSSMRGRTHIRAEGHLKNLRGFVAQITPVAPFFKFLPDADSELRFNYFTEDTDLAREFCPHRVHYQWPRLGEYKDVIRAPYTYDWTASEFWFRSEVDAALALMVRT